MNTPTTSIRYRSSFFAALVICIGPAHAQSFQVEEFIPAVGVDYYYNGLQTGIPCDTTSGANEYWDFSTLMIIPGIPPGQIAIEPGDASFIGYFPTAEIVTRKPADLMQPPSTEDFLVQQGNAIYFLGYHLGMYGRAIYSDPELRYGAMDLYGSLSDDFCYRAYTGDPGDSLDFCGSVDVSFISTGTLQLPYGTYLNARLVVTRELSWPVEFPDFISRMVRQDWFLPGSPHPVLSFFVNWENGEPQYGGGIMYTESTLISLGVQDQSTSGVLMLYPDPAVDRLTVQRTTFDAADLEVFTCDGRLVLRERMAAGQDHWILDVTELEPGVHVVRVNGMATARFVKQ